MRFRAFGRAGGAELGEPPRFFVDEAPASTAKVLPTVYVTVEGVTSKESVLCDAGERSPTLLQISVVLPDDGAFSITVGVGAAPPDPMWLLPTTKETPDGSTAR